VEPIEPIRPSPPAIATVDVTRVKVVRSERDNPDEEARREHDGDARGGTGERRPSSGSEAEPTPGSTPGSTPSVVIDAELLAAGDPPLPEEAQVASDAAEEDGEPPHIDVTV
jgi:hypothetical protein